MISTRTKQILLGLFKVGAATILIAAIPFLFAVFDNLDLATNLQYEVKTSYYPIKSTITIYENVSGELKQIAYEDPLIDLNYPLVAVADYYSGGTPAFRMIFEFYANNTKIGEKTVYSYDSSSPKSIDKLNFEYGFVAPVNATHITIKMKIILDAHGYTPKEGTWSILTINATIKKEKSYYLQGSIDFNNAILIFGDEANAKIQLVFTNETMTQTITYKTVNYDYGYYTWLSDISHVMTFNITNATVSLRLYNSYGTYDITLAEGLNLIAGDQIVISWREVSS